MTSNEVSIGVRPLEAPGWTDRSRLETIAHEGGGTKPASAASPPFTPEPKPTFFSGWNAMTGDARFSTKSEANARVAVRGPVLEKWTGIVVGDDSRNLARLGPSSSFLDSPS